MKFLRDNAITLASSIVTFALTFILTFATLRDDVGHNSERGIDHEARIRVLEAQRSVTYAVEAQGKQISELTSIVRQDHDSIVTLSTVVKQNSAR